VRPDAGQLEEVRWLIERHHELTQSPRAAELLKDWARTLAHMWLVAPTDQIRRIQAEQAGRVSAPA
jgi:glutamate synthase domain-containing protein 3